MNSFRMYKPLSTYKPHVHVMFLFYLWNVVRETHTSSGVVHGTPSYVVRRTPLLRAWFMEPHHTWFVGPHFFGRGSWNPIVVRRTPLLRALYIIHIGESETSRLEHMGENGVILTARHEDHYTFFLGTDITPPPRGGSRVMLRG
jgi:hypothetical protein